MMLKRLAAAWAGRIFWLRLDRKYEINDGGLYVLLMPEDDPELNEQALRHMDEMIAFRRAKGVMILTNQPWVLEHAPGCSDKLVSIQHVSESKIDKLLSFYEMYEFTERLLTVSLRRPYGRMVHKAVGVHGITKEDIVCICVYQIRDWNSTEAS